MELSRNWTLDPEIDFLNHGSFGACPIPVLERQAELRAELERQPVAFMTRTLPALHDAAREEVAEFLGADPGGLVTVPNATTGVNAVLRSLSFERGDELLVTDHGYNACRNTLDYVAARSGARIVVVDVPFPGPRPEDFVDALLEAVTDRSRLALIDHVTSPTGLVLPVATISAALSSRGIDLLIDGAHAPGMLPLALAELGASWYVGNCHKWLCSPKGAAILYARPDRRDAIRPVTISHGANVRRPGRTRFHDEFDWTGTDDPTAFLCVPTAIRFLRELVPGGWPEIRRRNHELVVDARRLLCEALEVEPPVDEEMLGSLATIPLPDREVDPTAPHGQDPLYARLVAERFELPVFHWPAPPSADVPGLGPALQPARAVRAAGRGGTRLRA